MHRNIGVIVKTSHDSDLHIYSLFVFEGKNCIFERKNVNIVDEICAEFP